MYQNPPDLDHLAQTITTNIRKISQNVNSMQQMIMQLQSSSDNDSLRAQLRQIQNYTQQLAKDTNKNLRDLSIQASTKQHKVLKERLANDFSDALKAFQSVQRKEADTERAEVKRARTSSQRSNLIELGGTGGGVGLLPPPPGSNTQQQQQQQPAGGYQQQALLMEEEANIEMLMEREESVRNLEQNIMDVNDIFKELATMVHEQGAAVDSIEANVEGATVRVTEGADQLMQARISQEKARKKMFCLILTGIIALAILITIIVVTTNKN